jgi:hypothetical protein
MALCLALAPVSLWAQQKPEPIKREQSKLWLEDVPGIANSTVYYFYLGWTPNYSAERFYAQTVARNAQLPRLHVNLVMLAPGFVWMQDSAMGEKYVKSWAFFKDRDVKMAREHGGGSSGVITVPFRSVDADCFAFLIRNVSIGLWEGMSSGGPPSLDGFYCAAQGMTLDAQLTQSVLASIRVTGDLSRVRTALVPAPTRPRTPPHIAGADPPNPAPQPTVSAPRPTPPAAPPPPTNTAAPAPAPTAAPPTPTPTQTAAAAPAARAAGSPIAAWTAPAGTRFVLDVGYLQIVKIDSHSVITVNSSNQTGRWTGGVIIRRSGTRIDTNPLFSLLPLAVGKEAIVEEWSDNGDRWAHTIRVTSTERVTIRGKSYEAFVVTVREQSKNANQGGFDRTRTLWVSSEAGGILRMRSKQDGGPRAALQNWDVLDILPPF